MQEFIDRVGTVIAIIAVVGLVITVGVMAGMHAEENGLTQPDLGHNYDSRSK